MTDADLVPYVAVAVAAGLGVEEAWTVVRSLAERGLDPEPFTLEIQRAVDADQFPGGLASA
ncbi:hypothetical protein GS810_01560 [Rhodococcus hoagii]|nr:hypothetical protein [Prescottella equi]NKT31578.1 hypothetical protein [Prescottella equi]